jgi:type VI secretion system secreted protein Hcp
MAVDMFLKIEGLEGESVDKTHNKEIDVLAWSWGMSQSGTMHMGKGGGAGKASFQDISVTKWIDSSSANLQQKCVEGDHFETATLTVRKAGKDPLEYLVIEMKQIIVTSVSTGGSGGEDKLTENVSLNFKEFKTIYTPQKEDGTGEAAKEFAWNIAENAVA